MATAPCQPTAAAQRIELLDAVRGFALAGVLLANLVAFSGYAFLPAAQRTALATAGVDRLLEPALSALVSGKFIALFALLFGVGFALQLRRAAADPGARWRYLRRLAALFVIGLLHAHLLWWGDVLRWYALLGLLMLPLRRWPAPALVLAGSAMVVAPAFLGALPGAAVTPQQADAAALAAFASHDWTTMLAGNRAYLDWWQRAHWGTALSAGGCMLVGIALGRTDVLHDPAAHARFWQRLALALPVGLALEAALTLAAYGRLPWLVDADGIGTAWRALNHAAGLLLALGYLAALAWWSMHAAGRRVLRPLAPVGRMALSHYLLQSVAGIALFYGVGLGIGPRHGLAGVVVAWAGLFALQIALSHWWLARFRFGPLEWLWRAATYARWPPLRR